MSGRRPRADYFILFLLTLLALGLRVATITAQPLSGDEAMHLQPLGLWEMAHLDLAFNPPLFRLLVRLCTMVSATPLAARLVPLLAGVATIPLLFFVLRRHLSLAAASWATLFLAIHPWHIRHCQTVRSYTLLTFLWLLSVAHTWSAIADSPARTTRTAMGRHLSIALLLLCTHYLGFMLLAMEIAILLAHRRWRLGLPLAALVGLAAVALGPLLGFAAGAKFAGSAAPYTAGFPFVGTALMTMATPGGLSLLAVWLLVAVGGLKSEVRILAWLAGGWLLAVPLIGLAIPIELRYALPALPLVLALAGHGAAKLCSTGGTIRKCAGAGITLLACAGIAYLIPTYYRAPLDPRPASERHRDLVHDATPIADFVQTYLALKSTSQSGPLVLVGRGPVEHQVLLALGGGRYPDVTTHSLTATKRSYRSAGFQLHVHESPHRPAEPCPPWPELPFALLVEAPFACDLPTTCQTKQSGGQFTLHHCPRRWRDGARRGRP